MIITRNVRLVFRYCKLVIRIGIFGVLAMKFRFSPNFWSVQMGQVPLLVSKDRG